MKNKSVLRFFIFAFSLVLFFGCKDDDADTDPRVNDPVVVDPIEDPDPNEEPDPDENPGEQSLIIDEKGGQLQSSDQNLLITIPEGIIDESVEISVSENEINDFTGGIGTMYSLESDIDQFPKPVTLSFNYEEDILPEGISPELLTVAFRRDGGDWMKKPNAVLDKAAMTITVETDHFSDWTLAADSAGFLDILIPIDTFQVNLPADESVIADRNAGDYSDTLIFYFEDKAASMTSMLYKVGSFDFTPGAEVEMFLSVKANNETLYGGEVTVIFSEFGTIPGELIVAALTGDIKDPGQTEFPVTGKFVVKRK